MNKLSKSEKVQFDISTIIKSFGTNSFRIGDLTNNKVIHVSVGSAYKYLERLYKNGCIELDSNRSGKVYKVIKALNFTPSKQTKSIKISSTSKLKKNSIGSHILEACPINMITFTKEDVWENMKDKTINKTSFKTAFSPLVRKGFLSKWGKSKFRLPVVKDVKKTNRIVKTNTAGIIKLFTSSNCKNKYKVADKQYSLVSRHIKGEVLILSGPNSLRHVESSAIITQGSSLYLVDINPDIFNIMRDGVKGLNIPNMNLICCNVNDLNITVPFQDLDFMTTWIGCDNQNNQAGNILIKRLLKQSLAGFKVAATSFTFSIRKFGKKDVVRFINSILHILDGHVIGFDSIKDSYGDGESIGISKVKKSYIHLHDIQWMVKGRIIDFQFYSYSDTGGHMMSCLIVYK